MRFYMKKCFRGIVFMLCANWLLITYELHAGPIITRLQEAKVISDQLPSLKQLLPFLEISAEEFYKEFFEANGDIVKTNSSDDVQSKNVIISFEKMTSIQNFVDSINSINSKLPAEKIKLEELGKSRENDLSYIESFRKHHLDTSVYDGLTQLKTDILKEYSKRISILSAFRKLMETKSGKLLLIRILVAIKKIDQNPEDPRYPRIVIGYGEKFSISREENGKSTLKILLNDEAVSAFHLEHDQISNSLVLPIKFPLFNKPVNGGSFMHTKDKVPLDLIIFHEMVHWLHKLDNLKYLSRSKTGQMADGTISVKDHPLFLYYYGDHRSCSINTDNWKTSLIIWNNSADVHRLPPQVHVNFEEMLTICGLRRDAWGYIPGDELSENLYRAELKLPLRFGHRVITFIENEEVYEKVYDCAKYYCDILGIVFNKECVGQETPNTYIGSFLSEISRDSTNVQHGIGRMYFYIIPDGALNKHFNILIPNRGIYVGKNAPLDSYYYFCYQDCKNIISRLILE